MSDHVEKHEDEGEDSEEDEDYKPDEESDDEGLTTATHSTSATDTGGTDKNSLPPQKQKAVDDAFASLFATTTPDILNTASNDKRNNKKKSKKSSERKKRLLASIFGPSQASKLLQDASSSSKKHKINNPAAILPDSNTVSLSLPSKRTIIETKKFAGQEIQLKRVVHDTVTSSSSPPPPSPEKRAPKKLSSGMDQLLNKIANPQKISTVAKTSNDWDAFKTNNDLEEELTKRAEGNKAFLVKKDFLNRVDQRRFEIEKVGREKERVQRDAASGGV